jgi:hypothetical protein
MTASGTSDSWRVLEVVYAASFWSIFLNVTAANTLARTLFLSVLNSESDFSFRPSLPGYTSVCLDSLGTKEKELFRSVIDGAIACNLSYTLSMTRLFPGTWSRVDAKTRRPNVASVLAQELVQRDRTPASNAFASLLDLMTQYRAAFSILQCRHSNQVELVDFDQELGVVLYADVRSKTLTAAFAGTSSLADVVTDVMAWPTLDETLQCRVHTGFRRRALQALPVVKRGLANCLEKPESQKEKWSLILCGHSLGGAVATLVAEWLCRDSTCSHALADVTLYTMAPAPVFWKSYPPGQEPVAVKRLSVVHELDVVDLSLLPFGYLPTRGGTLVLGLKGDILHYSEGRASRGTWALLLSSIFYHMPGNSLSGFVRALGPCALAQCIEEDRPPESSANNSEAPHAAAAQGPVACVYTQSGEAIRPENATGTCAPYLPSQNKVNSEQ